MDKIKTVKIKNPDGSVSEETYTISVDAKDVDMKNGKDLQDTIGDINIDRDGNIAEQLNKYKDYDDDIETLYNNISNLENVDTELSNNITNLQNNKINKTDIIDNLESNESNKVLSAKQGKVLNDSIEGLNSSLGNISNEIMSIETTLSAKANTNDVANTYETQINHNNDITLLNSRINEVTNGSPLVANSVSEMTDTSRIYLNVTNGHWY